MRIGSRGQVLPLWIAGILATLSVMFAALTYGNTLRWQIRAQNAADAAAQAIMTIQTERWNSLEEILYSSAIEEYRTRMLLDGLMLTVQNSGGCAYNHTCPQTYTGLRTQYLKSANRYSADAALLHSTSYYATLDKWKADGQALMKHLTAHCFAAQNVQPDNVSADQISKDGNDCAFKYIIKDMSFRPVTGLVAYDATNIIVPGGATPGPTAVVPSATPNPNLFGPGQVDIVTCAKVAPIVPNFGPVQFAPYYAVGQAAATAVMMEEDWFEPGTLIYKDKFGQTNPFQPTEKYDATGQIVNWDWYEVNYGGNKSVDSHTLSAFASSIFNDEMSVRLGWWNSIPQHPYGTAFDPSAKDGDGNPIC